MINKQQNQAQRGTFTQQAINNLVKLIQDIPQKYKSTKKDHGQMNQKQVCLQLQAMIHAFGISALVLLKNYLVIQKYITKIVQPNRQRKDQSFRLRILAIIQIHFPYFDKHLRDIDQNYKNAVNQFTSAQQYKIAYKAIQEKYEDINKPGSSKITKIIQSLYQEFFKLLTETKYNQKSKVKSFIEDKLKKLHQERNSYHQFAINWLKKYSQIMSGVQQKYLCCKIYFEETPQLDHVQGAETETQQFKKYHWPINNQSLIFHLQKTVVGFLNRSGGIIYMGLFEQKTKGVKIVGIQLKQKQKIEMRKFIRQKVLKNVFPESQFKGQDYKGGKDILETRSFFSQYENNQKYLDESYEYFYNPYVSTDFIPVVNPNTMLNKPNYYIARIKVKPGNQFDLYYLLSSKAPINPQFYIREDKSVKKKLMNEAKDELYRRLKLLHDAKKIDPSEQHLKNENLKLINKIKPFHEECRFQLLPTTQQIVYKFQNDTI